MKTLGSKFTSFRNLALPICAMAFIAIGYQNCGNSHNGIDPVTEAEIRAAAALSPQSATIFLGDSITITSPAIAGGAHFVMRSGDGTVHPTTGVYSAPNTETVAVIGLAFENIVIDGLISTITVVTAPVVATPTPAATATPTPTPLPTASATPTPSPTPAPSATPPGEAATPTPWPTATPSPTPTPAPTATPEPVSDLQVSPSKVALAIGEKLTFKISGGEAPYSFKVSGKSASFDPKTSELTALSPTGTVTLVVRDSKKNSVEAHVVVKIARAYADAMENRVGEIACPADTVVTKIEFASYGSPEGTPGAYKIGKCHAAGSDEIANKYCVGRQKCEIASSNDVFGDPCSGVYKQLVIQAICDSPTSPAPEGPFQPYEPTPTPGQLQPVKDPKTK